MRLDRAGGAEAIRGGVEGDGGRSLRYFGLKHQEIVAGGAATPSSILHFPPV